MQQFSLHNLLPLRSVADIEIVDEDDIEAYVALPDLFSHLPSTLTGQNLSFCVVK
jgi:hypothetical protein